VAVTFAKVQGGDVGRIQDAIIDAFAKCVAVSGLFVFTTQDPTGVPSGNAPRFMFNTSNLRLWVNCGSSWHYAGLT
jgi:hypothetical protein